MGNQNSEPVIAMKRIYVEFLMYQLLVLLVQPDDVTSSQYT